MTGVLTWISARLLRRKYYIDLRDIFSETISDLFALKSSFLSTFFRYIFSFLDKQVLNSAAGVNVVSEGFPEYFEKKGIKSKISDIVIVDVKSFSKVTSPSYDLGHKKDDLVEKWKKYYN